MGFLRRLLGQQQVEEMGVDVSSMIEEGVNMSPMIEEGWTFYPANATQEERSQAIMNCIDGGRMTMYPPGYEKPRRRFGLF